MTWNFASINEALKDGVPYGYDVPAYNFDFAQFVEKRHAQIKKLNGIYESNWANDGIDLIHGTAKFISKNELDVTMKDGSGTVRYTAPHICIATGSWASKPTDITGAEYGITSDEFFSIKKLPKKMVFVGAGYISVELAGVMNALGVETHMFIRGPTFLRKFDPMVQETLTQHYIDSGIHIHKSHPGIKSVEQLKSDSTHGEDPTQKLLKLTMNDGTTMETNELLWAIGRPPKTDTLNLSAIPDLRTNEKSGHLIVDQFQNTTVPGIYALGDVTGQAELTPVAIAAGRHLSGRLFGPPELKATKPHLSYENIPTVVFAHPEVGTTGLTEPAAIEKFGKENVKVYHTRFSDMFYYVFSPEEKEKKPTEFKIICEGPEERVVGLHILGRGVGEMMQGFGVAVKMGARKRDLDSCVAIHPTAAEELVTMR